ncbi:MAG: phosphoglycerate kinase [bacterium]
MVFPAKTIYDLDDIAGKKALVRVDFNVPLDEDGKVSDDTRLRAALPTIKYLLEQGAIPVLMSHLGRPGGEVVEELRLAPVVEPLQDLLGGVKIKLATDTVGDSAREMVGSLQSGQVGLLENLRFSPGEKSCDDDFSKKLAGLADFYVSDAFGTAHRAHASMTGVPRYLSPAVAGDLLTNEYKILAEVRDNPERPFVVLLGGAKVSDKLAVIERFLERADKVLIGGAMAYTFSLARGEKVGDSLVEPDFVDEAKRLLDNRDSYRGELVLPLDTVIVSSSDVDSKTEIVPAGEIPEGWEGMDIGPESSKLFAAELSEAAMVFWNGPMGVFEMEQFAAGTNFLARALADIEGRVVVGGGDSVSAVNKAGVQDKFYHISTGGGASLALVRGDQLPGIEALDKRE